MLGFIFVFIGVVFAVLNIYCAFKIKKCFGEKRKYYYLFGLPAQLLFLFLLIIGFFMRGSNFLSKEIQDAFALIGFMSSLLMFYMSLLYIAADITAFVMKRINLNERVKNVISKIYCRGITVILIACAIIVYGYFNASDIQVTEYSVDVDRKAGDLDKLKLVFISDTHIGTTVKKKEIDFIVDKVNSIKPDIVCFGGDIFDEGTSTRLMEYTRDAFSNINSLYGSYYITGNHEYYMGNMDDGVKYIEDAGINVLMDKYEFIGNSFYIAGRIDRSSQRSTGEERKTVGEIMDGADMKYPVILLDHQPVGIAEAENAGVDLQLSGHTHSGQIFPLNFITSISNDLNYGYLKKSDFNIIVSSGCGTWGIPVRIGSSSEIVCVDVNFKKKGMD